MMTPVLSCANLSVVRNGRRVLDGVSLELRQGEVLGILGSNGAGKSTLLSTLAGELPISTALHTCCPVRVAGKAIVELDPPDLARRRAVLPQKPELAFDLGVDEVVSMGLYPFPELSPEACVEQVRKARDQADVGAFWHRRYLQLSGGEQQRVQFARALVQVLAASTQSAGCSLLLDEPSSSLDPLHQHGLLRAARCTAREAKAGVLVVLHDVNLAAQYCDRLALLSQGRIVACGPPSDVLTPVRMEQVYGVATHVQAHPVHAGLPLIVFL